MKRAVVMVGLALAAVAAALLYQEAKQARDYRALLARGDRALADDQTFGAIEAYSGAIALRPDSVLAHLRRGEAYERRVELEAAARDFRAAATLDPAAPRPLEELGDVFYKRQWYPSAVEAYDACLRLDDRTPRVTYKLALARYRSGDLSGADGAANQAIRQDGRSAEAFYLLGLCRRDQHRPEDAEQAFQRAIALAPTLVAPRDELADLYRLAGRHAEELEQLQTIAGLDRDHVERQVAVAGAYARADRADLAVLTLGNALERTPDDPTIYAALGRVWLDIAEAQHDRVALNKALEALTRAANASAAASATLTDLGRAQLLNGDADAAMETLQRATARYPVEPRAFLVLATAAERQGHLDGARQALIEYGALAGDDAELPGRAEHIAAMSLRLHDPADAARWLERAIAVAPSDVTLLAALADAQLRAGDRDAAHATLARARDRDPENPALRALVRRLQ